jgi:MscS family membrane protein
MNLPFLNMLAQVQVDPAAPIAEPVQVEIVATPTDPATPADQARTLFESFVANDTIRNTTPMGWGILFGGIFGGVMLGKIVQTMLRAAGARLTAAGWPVKGIFVRSFAGPANLAIIGIGISIGTGYLARSEQLDNIALTGMALIYTIAIGWLLYNLVDVVDASLRSVTSKTQSKLDDQLVPLVTKTMRIFLIVIVALFAAENIFGANIGAWLAGLGIAGLAVSLAAQDSLRNIFGSVTILLDQPFAQGEFVRIGEFMGTVESVGFRSTRLRTPDGSLVTIPNATAANANVENLARRPSIRRNMDITITYDTPPHKIEEALAIVKGILTDPEITESFDMEKQPPRVVFDKLNADSLNIRASYWFRPVDIWLFLAHSEKVNLRLMRRFNDAGIDFAFPTSTTYLVSDPKRPLVMNQAGEPVRQ